MKTKILVGAVAALLYGGVALAGGNKDCPPGYEKKDTQASMDTGSQAVEDQSLTVIETEPVDSSIGGSGQAGIDEDVSARSEATLDANKDFHGDVGVGGSGQAGEDIMLRCEPVKRDATGGSGWNDNYGSDIGGSGVQSEPLREPEITPPAEPVIPPAAPSGAFAPIEEREEVKEDKTNMRGLTVMVGGGVEGYTGALAPEINPGPSYGVTAAIKPSKVLGIELGYSGAVNNLDSTALGADSGPDLVRNGGQAALTFGLTATPVQPYVLGGIGFSDYNFRGAAASGFGDDLVGNVPVGAGLRTHVGDFTLDLRGNYNFLFDQEFAGVDDGLNENGRYSGTLNIGGTF
ncbi:outer membrane protein [Hyalangium rubrum]|uniref:Outer membrane protein beta-barrel domain-containing protein n=1 Tax=Hyalangium rubrum TaxID=3103134 RepID=A0ABU5HFP5_9BACT|nr:hypothetical protein [Hyalangium sp. s54d21]MDY7232292.1 hypothetical protein [Hyalangium sp. s54d21]